MKFVLLVIRTMYRFLSYQWRQTYVLLLLQIFLMNSKWKFTTCMWHLGSEDHLLIRMAFIHWSNSQPSIFLFVILCHLLNLRRFSPSNTNSYPFFWAFPRKQSVFLVKNVFVYLFVCLFSPIVFSLPNCPPRFSSSENTSFLYDSSPPELSGQQSRYKCRSNSQMQCICPSDHESRTVWSKCKQKEGLCPRPWEQVILLKTLTAGTTRCVEHTWSSWSAV